MKIKVRSEKPADYDAIGQINDLAFTQENEGRLVEELRKNPAFIPELSLVAFMEDEPVGHILFFPIVIDNSGKLVDTLSLAPMAVLPEFQNMGIGSLLIEEGLKQARKRNYTSVLVLGHEHYYPRFGFLPASKFGIQCPFKSPDESFMALELFPGKLSGVSGIAIYPSEFNEV